MAKTVKAPVAKRFSRIGKNQKRAAYAISMVAATLTGLSLNDLAAGTQLVTGVATWQAWAFAFGIDLGFIGLEVAHVIIPNPAPAVKHVFARYAMPTTVGTLIASACMNASQFAQHAEPYSVMWFAAIAMGIGIPAMIYSLTRVSTTLLGTRH